LGGCLESAMGACGGVAVLCCGWEWAVTCKVVFCHVLFHLFIGS
jgi:hypothetical protein